ncbi:type II toxin-antitoxin system BrnA family antitoxin [Alcanivorax sp. 1008]|uniref:type II toxin-antitoxin system BrnA family antitoxin n=1 Tax=Alcanivorax sp. 1008 TaxID=2816853 RepID=UPI001E4943D3|nr:CopG family transcriptional regulator [Alcanivorax sp. 1008]
MKAKDFDRKFDDGREEIVDDLDLPTARRVNQEQKRINVDFPAWVVEALDREASRIGVTRQSIIKVWLVERLQAELREAVARGELAVEKGRTYSESEAREKLSKRLT